MRIKRLSILIIMCLLILLMAIPAYAAGNNVINIDFSVENHTKGIDGAEFALIKVLNLKDGVYYVNTSLEALNFTVDDVFERTEDTAKLIASKADSVSERAVTDTNGKASFNGLEDGVWLICQTGRSGGAAAYNVSSPCLVSVPWWEGNVLNNSVTIYPKTTVIVTPEPTVKPDENTPAPTHQNPATGDDAHLGVYFVLSASSFLALLTLVIYRRRKSE